MGDIMLHGVLNMPMPNDPKELGIIEWMQFRDRAREASVRINADAATIARLTAQLAAANARADQARDAALVEAAKACNDRGAQEEQAYGLTRGTQNFYRARDVVKALRDKPAPFPAPSDRTGKEPCGECRLRPGETCDICNAYMPAHVAHHEMHAADAMRLLRDKPAPPVTVREAILEVWGCCEELEDEALAKLSVVKTEHEKGFWAGQKITAKRIRRATQMPIAGGGDE